MSDRRVAPGGGDDPEVGSRLDALLGATPQHDWRRIASLVLLLGALVVGAVLVFRFVQGEQSPYLFAPVTRGDLAPRVFERGTLKPVDITVVNATLDGRVAKLAPADGQWIAEGQPLATIAPDHARRAIAGGRAAMEAAQADVTASEATLAQARARLARFQNVWRRSDGRVPSQGEMDAARADLARARAGLEAALARRDGARGQLAADAERARPTQVRAPFASYVLSRQVALGAVVTDGDPLLTLAARPDRIAIDVPLDAVAVRYVKPGTPARITLDNPNGPPRRGRVARIDDDGRAWIVLDNPGAELRPGMAASVEIALPERRNVLLVPDAALAFDPRGGTGDRRRLFVVAEDGSARPVPIVLGAGDGAHTEIFGDGIAPDTDVITGWRNPAGDGAQKTPVGPDRR